MTFDELKAEFNDRGGDIVTGQRPDRMINQAYREICNLQPWPFLLSTATGDPDVGVVEIADLRRVLQIRDVSSHTTGVPLMRVLEEDLANDNYDLTQTGRPEVYYIDGTTTVRAFPVGGTLHARYVKRVEPFVGSAEPIFDEEYHPLIVDRAMVELYKDADEFQSARDLQADLNTRLIAMVEDYMVSSRDAYYVPVEAYDG